jgi:hypothetical protein
MFINRATGSVDESEEICFGDVIDANFRMVIEQEDALLGEGNLILLIFNIVSQEVQSTRGECSPASFSFMSSLRIIVTIFS